MTPRLTPRGLLVGGRHLPCSIGRGGITADKREGDGATPAGIWHIADCLYRPDRIARPAPWAQPVRPGDLWSDDPADPAYNSRVRAPHPCSHETLRRADKLYDLILTTDWNRPETVPGRGSAIFLHRWRKPHHPTEGCLAFAPQDLLWLARRFPPGTAIAIPTLSSSW